MVGNTVEIYSIFFKLYTLTMYFMYETTVIYIYLHIYYQIYSFHVYTLETFHFETGRLSLSFEVHTDSWVNEIKVNLCQNCKGSRC